MSERLAGTVALVTGATGGIGSAVCRRLASDGAKVAVSDLDLSACAVLAAEIDGMAVELDVCESISASAALVHVTETDTSPARPFRSAAAWA